MARLQAYGTILGLAMAMNGCCSGSDDKTAPTARLDFDRDFSDGSLRLTGKCDDSDYRTKLRLSNGDGVEVWTEVDDLEEQSGLAGYQLGIDGKEKGDWQKFRSEGEVSFNLEGLVGFHDFSFSCKDKDGNEGVPAVLSLYLYSDGAALASEIKGDTICPGVWTDFYSKDEFGDVSYGTIWVDDEGSGVRSVRVSQIYSNKEPSVILEKNYDSKYLSIELFEDGLVLPNVHFEGTSVYTLEVNDHNPDTKATEVVLFQSKWLDDDTSRRFIRFPEKCKDL